MNRFTITSADIDNLWHRMPYVLTVAVFIWAVLLWGFGLMLREMSEEEHVVAPITAELMEVQPPEKHVVIPSPPKPKPVRKNTPQLPAPAQKSILQKPIVQSPVQTPASSSTPAIALPPTNMTSGKDTIPYNVPAGRKSVATTTQSSGDTVAPPQFGAAYLNNPKPQYPPFARRMGIQGTVMLKVLVSKEGFALKVQIATSSGSDLLDDAALLAVKSWRFVPARKGDQPVDEWVQVPIAFHLSK
jgi:protein TonB